MNGELASLLGVHEYRFGFETNCRCGAPSIWTWQDWVEHVMPLIKWHATAGGLS